MSETISQLPLASEANLSDLIPVTQGSVGAGTGITRTVTGAMLADLVPTGVFASLDLSSLPTSNPGGGKPWLNGNPTDGYVLCVGP